jgi:hypothetical protein
MYNVEVSYSSGAAYLLSSWFCVLIMLIFKGHNLGIEIESILYTKELFVAIGKKAKLFRTIFYVDKFKICFIA